MTDRLNYDLNKTMRNVESKMKEFEDGPMKSMVLNNEKSAVWVQEEYSKLGNLRQRLEEDFKGRQAGMEKTLMKYVEDAMNNFLIPEGKVEECDKTQL